MTTSSKQEAQSNRESKRPRLLDSDDENEQSNGNNVTKITWRMDPKDSLSDWTIETRSPCGSSTTYHVHKSFLAVGIAKCDYFARLFQMGKNDDDDDGQQFLEFGDCTTRFNFDHKEEADAFPNFLDFLYDIDNKYITTDNAIAMYSLAEYFACRHLRRCVRRFFEDNLSIDTVVTFFVDAEKFRNEQFMNAIIRYSAMDVRRVLSNEFANVSNHIFWLKILSQYNRSSKQSKQLSRVIAVFCVINRKTINLDLFTQLTDESKLPKISYDAAMELMAVEYTLLSNMEKQTNTSTESSKNYNSVQSRCEVALTNRCHKLDLNRVAYLLKWVDSKILFRLIQLFQTELKQCQQNSRSHENSTR